MSSNQNPLRNLTTCNGGNQVTYGIPRPIRTATRWYDRISTYMLVLAMWVVLTFALATFAMAAGYFFN
jgi:hypothetical protein